MKVMIKVTPESTIFAVHLSAASALPMIKAAKAEGLPLTVETCHHYLRSFAMLNDCDMIAILNDFVHVMDIINLQFGSRGGSSSCHAVQVLSSNKGQVTGNFS